MSTINLPLSYRKKEVDKVFSTILSGDSCILVGIGNVGKSKLLRYLQQEDIQREKLGTAWENTLFIYTDSNKLLEQSEWGLYELMIHQILISLSAHDSDLLIYEAIDEFHQRSANLETKHLALRFLERCIALVCNRLDMQIVFLIDEFDRLCRMLPSSAFAALRSIRDDYKYRLMYVIASRKELNSIRIPGVNLEDFEELVGPNTIYLGAYSEADARNMIASLEERNQKKLDEKKVLDILSNTGGHPGLIRSVFPLVYRDSVNPLIVYDSDFSIQRECWRIWNSLDESDQRTLANLANPSDNYTPHTIIHKLEGKGLICKLENTLEFFSPIFADFIRSVKPLSPAHILVDHLERCIWIDEHQVEKLTPLEYKLIEYLDTRRGQVCTRDEIISVLYPDEVIDGISDASIDAVLKRLRKKIEPEPDHPRFLLTMRGHGIKLADGEKLSNIVEV